MGELSYTVGGDSNLVSFKSAARVPITSLKAHFKPKQDLHGYSKPWPAGGGKNKLGFINAENIGNNNNRTITFTNDYITINATGTVTTNAIVSYNNMTTYCRTVLTPGTYTFSVQDFDTNIPNISKNNILIVSTGAYYALDGESFTTSEDVFFAGINYNTAFTWNAGDYIKFHLQIEEGSSVTDWEPYENICPIEGWNNVEIKFSNKNMAHIIGYSAQGGNFETTPKSSNNYGTSLSTTSPNSSIIITQTEYPSTNNPYNYTNGYFCIWIDNLEFYGYYDISFKIENVSHPANIDITSMKICGPNGGSFQSPTVINNNYLLFKNIQMNPYIKNGIIQNRKGFEIRNAGFSFTLSELMVTPAKTNDTIFESYCGEVIPVTFPITGKNLFDAASVIKLDNMKYEDNIFSNTAADTRATPNYVVQQYKYGDGSGYISAAGTLYVSTIGRISFLFTIDSTECKYIRIKHNGTTRNLAITIPWPYALGTYAISFDVLSADPTTVNGLQIKDIQIERGTTATVYESYSSNNTYYGGYVDPIRGEIWAEQVIKTFTLSDSDTSTEYTNNTMYRFSFNVPLWGQGNVSRRIAMSDTTHYAYTNEDVAHWYTTTNNNKGYVYVWLPKTFLNTDTITILATLYTPQLVGCISSNKMITALGHNNVWTSTNGATEVSYAIHDTAPIRAAKHRINAYNSYKHGELILWLNGEDAPVNGYWIDRVNGMAFQLFRGATYDSTNKLYDCSGQGLLRKADINDGTVNFGHHFRVEFDVEYNRELSTNGIFFDVGSLHHADRGFGFGFASKTSTQMSFNWKMEGNASQPFANSTEKCTHVNMPIVADEFIRYRGYYDVSDSGKGYDTLRIKINDKIKKYGVQLHKESYKETWISNAPYFTIGNGVYYANNETELLNDTQYLCYSKIHEIKVYIYD